jgi:hypothetical protein
MTIPVRHNSAIFGIISAMRVKTAACLLLLIVAVIGRADTPQSATVKFTLDFPGANPSHYEISVTANGRGVYSSNGQLNKDSAPADPEPLEFTLSDKTRARIFDLAQRAHFFEGKIDSSRKNMANTGAKTLSYKDDSHNTQATYNYSSQQPVQDVTAIFQALSTTLEYGRRLAFFHKYQKLAIDEELKRMEELQRYNSLGDVQSIAQVLKQIADDPSVITVTRSRALRLLAGQSH